MSSGLSVRAALEAFVAGRASAQGVVPLVAAAFYRKAEAETRDALRPLMAVIERAAPGVVQLAGTEGAPGFAIATAERSFPAAYETALRQAGGGGHEVDEEIAHLLVHGTLHLLGYDHAKAEDEVRMRARERRVLGELSIEPHYPS